MDEEMERRMVAVERIADFALAEVQWARQDARMADKEAFVARKLATAASREAGDVGQLLRAQTRLFEALRETQIEQGKVQIEQGKTLIEQGKRLDTLETKVDAGFSMMATG